MAVLALEGHRNLCRVADLHSFYQAGPPTKTGTLPLESVRCVWEEKWRCGRTKHMLRIFEHLHGTSYRTGALVITLEAVGEPFLDNTLQSTAPKFTVFLHSMHFWRATGA